MKWRVDIAELKTGSFTSEPGEERELGVNKRWALYVADVM